MRTPDRGDRGAGRLEDRERVSGVARTAPEPTGGVADVAADALLLGRLEPPALQPLRGPRGAARGVYDEVRLQPPRAARSVHAGHDQAGHPLSVLAEGQVEDRAAVVEHDARRLGHAASDGPLEEHPADRDRGEPAGAGGVPRRAHVVLHRLLGVARRRPGRDEVGGEPREELLHRLAAAGQQPVGVPDLRHAPSGHRSVGQLVAVEDDDLAVRLAQGSRGQQAGDARADDQGAVDGSGHGSLLTDGVCGGSGYEWSCSGSTIAPARPRTLVTGTMENDGLPAVRSATIA